MADDVQVLSIPYGSIVALRGVADADQATVEAQLRQVAEHDRFVVVFLDAGDDAKVLGADDVVKSFRATMADEVSDEVVDRAVDAARTEANEVASAHVKQAKADDLEAVDPPPRPVESPADAALGRVDQEPSSGRDRP